MIARGFLALFVVSVPLQLFAERDRFSDLQSDLDGLRDKIHCYQVERDILEEKFHKQEAKLSSLQKSLNSSKSANQELTQNKLTAHEGDMQQLKKHANETTASLQKFGAKLADLETQLSQLKESVQILVKLVKKESLPSLGAKTYKVKPGDNLEKIAKTAGISISDLKKWNKLSSDKIIVGKELVISHDDRDL